MKKHLFTLTIIITGFSTWAQDLPTKNSILGVERHLLKEDFLLNEANGIFPKKVIENYVSVDFIVSKSTTTLVFNDNKQLVNKRIISDHNSAKEEKELKFTYNNSKLSKIDFYENGKARFYFPNYTYTYNENGKLVKILTKRTSISEPHTIAEFSYINNGNEIIKNGENGKRTKYVLSNNQELVASEEELNENSLAKAAKLYMPSGRGIKIIQYPDLIDTPQKQEDIAEYFVDEKGYVYKFFKIIGNSRIDIESGLLYDKHNNWVVKLNEFNEDITVREITYSNGDVTGYSSTNDPKLLAELKGEKTNESAGTPQNGVYWKKSGDLFWFYNNGKAITDHIWLYRNKNTDVAYSPVRQTFYEIYNHDASPENQFHKGKKVTPEIGENGFWFKYEKENGETTFAMYQLDGNEYGYSSIASFSEDTHGNYICIYKDGSKVTLSNFKGSQLYTIHPIITFDASKHGTPTVSANKTPSKTTTEAFTWSKNAANTEYYIYIDGTEALSTFTSFFMDDKLAVVDYKKRRVYVIDDFKNQPAGKQLKVNNVTNFLRGFWYKNKQGEYYAFNRFGKPLGEVTSPYCQGDNLFFQEVEFKDDTYKLHDPQNCKPNTIYVLYDKDDPLDKTSTKYLMKYSNTSIKPSVVAFNTKTKLNPCTSNSDCNKDGFVYKKHSETNRLYAYQENGTLNGPRLQYRTEDYFEFGIYLNGFATTQGAKFEVTSEHVTAIDFNTGIGFRFHWLTASLESYAVKVKNGKIIGKGKFTNLPKNDSNKSCLYGDGQNGLGLVYENGDIYVGYFVNGKKEGFGVLIFNENQNVFYGSFKNDDFNGFGLIKNDDAVKQGPFQLGYFKDGKLHGRGIKVDSEENVSKGVWNQGKLITSTFKQSDIQN